VIGFCSIDLLGCCGVLATVKQLLIHASTQHWSKSPVKSSAGHHHYEVKTSVSFSQPFPNKLLDRLTKLSGVFWNYSYTTSFWFFN